MRPLEPRNRRDTVTDFPCRTEGDELTQASAITKLVARVGAKICRRRPTESERRAVETGFSARQMKAALESKFKRELFVDGQAILQTDDGEAVRAVDAVLKLIAA